MNVIGWGVVGFLTEFSNESMKVGRWCVQRVGVNVWIYMCVRVDDGDGCVGKGFIHLLSSNSTINELDRVDWVDQVHFL